MSATCVSADLAIRDCLQVRKGGMIRLSEACASKPSANICTMMSCRLFFSLILLTVFALFGVVMELKIEQRSVLKFLVKKGDTPIECWRELRRGFGDETLSQKTIRKWHKGFREGHTSTKDQPWSGRPKTARNADKVDELRGLLQDDRTQTVQSLARQLQVGKSSVHKMLKKDLKFSKLSPRFVPKDLNDDQCRERVWICQENLDSLKADDSFISKIITGDESWIAVLELMTKQASLQWLPKGTISDRPSKARPQRGEKKSMFTIFFDQRGPVLSEFKLPNETVISKMYIEVLRTLREQIRRKRPELWADQSFILHHDNASPHTATPTMEFLASHNTKILPHPPPPYSPDLALADYFLFGRLKADIRGHRHQTIDDMQTAVFRTLKAIPVQEFHDVVNMLPMRWMKCISMEGGYFEGHHLVINPRDFGLEVYTGDDGTSSNSDSDAQE